MEITSSNTGTNTKQSCFLRRSKQEDSVVQIANLPAWHEWMSFEKGMGQLCTRTIHDINGAKEATTEPVEKLAPKETLFFVLKMKIRKGL